jgi:hypothetical protein
MLKYANQKRRLLEFNMGDKVLLKLTLQIWKKIMGMTQHRGLVPRYDGPFKIIKKVGVVVYRLKLPEWLKIHPTFHVSYLRPFYEDEDPKRSKSQRAPPTIHKQFDDGIVKIMDHCRLGQHRKNRRT